MQEQKGVTMKNKRGKLSAVLITMLACTFVASIASAAIVQLDAIDSGWYKNNGLHGASNKNYIIGDYLATDGRVYRNYFVFDLSGITLPIGAANLSVYNPTDGYISADPTETWNLWEVSSSMANLMADHAAGDPVGLDIYDDLGGTNFLGTGTVSAADNDTMVNVALNGNALVLLNNAIGSQWAVGGSITTLDAVDNSEVMFSWTNETSIRRLILTTCEVSRGQVCYSYCPMGSCPASYCNVNVPGMAGCMNIGRITYCGCTLGSCAPSQCVVYIPVP
jgi:large repetitive protein